MYKRTPCEEGDTQKEARRQRQRLWSHAATVKGCLGLLKSRRKDPPLYRLWMEHGLASILA